VKHAFIGAVLLSSSAALAQTPLDEEPIPGATQAIQERSYRLTYEIGVGGGLMPVDPFTKQAYLGGIMALHFSDAIAWQIARGGYAFSWQSGLRQQLERDFQVLPSAFPAVQFFVGSQLLFKPFYGKSAVANKFVIHYEAYLELGVSVFKYTNAFRPGIDVGGGLRVFQNKILSYRLEVLDTIILTGGITNSVSVNLLLCLNIGSSE
jgi:outer membrane beta-barrel protein